MITKTNFLNIISKTTLFLFVVVLMIIISSGFLSSKSTAGSLNAKFGDYAWSENIGWIDFQPKNSSGVPLGGVSIDSSGNVIGYAWSENIGWIRFGGLGNFPTGPGTVAANAKIVGSDLIGWARACSGMYKTSMTESHITCDGNENSRTDGWDGWISLGGTNYGVKLNSTNDAFSGYAWGSDVIGWINFTLSLSSVDIDITADDAVVFKGGSTIIRWSAPGATNCSLNKVESGLSTTLSPSATSGSVTSGPLIKETTFTANCTNETSVLQGSVIVGIKLKPLVLKVDSKGITWESPDGGTCTLMENGVQISADTQGSIFKDVPLDNNYTLSCVVGGVTVDSGVVTAGDVTANSECIPTQPNQTDGNLYVNQKTTWTMKNSLGTASNVTWKGTNIVEKTTLGDSLVKIYTTVGSKSISGTGVVTKSTGKTFSSTCATTTMIKQAPEQGKEQ